MKKPIETKERKSQSGLLPTQGLITAEELASRLRLSSVANLKVEMERKQIKHISINGKRIYRCRDIDLLFGGDS